MEDIKIKPEPEAAGSPTGFSEEDIYEDAGDLEFNPSTDFQKLYLARVPKYIWEAWSKLDDDAEIPLGTIRQSMDPDGKVFLSCPLECSMLMQPRCAFRCSLLLPSPNTKLSRKNTT